LSLPVSFFFILSARATPFSPEVKPFLEKWVAIGSGCSGETDRKDGDATLVEIPPTREAPLSRVYKFKLPKMKLESPLPSGQQTTLEFGRECSIRMTLFPPPDLKIVNVTSRSSFRVFKSPQMSAWIQKDAMLGNQTVAKARYDFAEGTAVSNRTEEIKLIPGRSGAESVPQSNCGQPRILGLDYIFGVKRKSPQDAAFLSLEGGSEVEIVVDLAKC
jgi:hypothetical protein